MEYQVSARKHRPMTFAEVTGQTHVVRTLTNALASGRTAHAYLFSGMRGVGKTTMARILAKALNCEKGPTSTPCLACVSCREIGAGMSFDDRSWSLLVGACDGSLREALSLLDQAVACGGKRVEAEQLMILLGAVPHELLRGALEAILARDAAGALKALAAVQDHGSDVRQFCGELMEHVRNLLVARIVPDAGDLIELGPEEQAEIKADAARLTVDHVQELFRIFMQAEDCIRASQYPWFVVEMAAVRACRVVQAQAAPSPGRPETRVPSVPSKVAPQAAPPSRASESGPTSAPRTEQSQPIHEATPSPSARQEPVSLDWEAVVARVLAERPNIGAFLEDSGLVGTAGDLVTVGFSASAGTAMRMMQQGSYQQAVAEACSALARPPLLVRGASLDGR